MSKILILGKKSEKKTELINSFVEQGYHLYENWQERILQCHEKGIDPVRDVNTYFELYSRYPGSSGDFAIIYDEGELQQEELQSVEEKVIAELKGYVKKVYRVNC